MISMMNVAGHSVKMRVVRFLIAGGCFFLIGATVAHGQTFSEPTQGPTAGQVSEPVNVGLFRQVKPSLGVIGANDFTIPFFAIDYGLFPAQTTFLGANNEDIGNGYYTYPGTVLRTSVEETLTSLLTKAWAPKHYHVEVARVPTVSPGVPGECESLDDVLPKCSLSYSNSSGANHRSVRLRSDIVDAFCKDEDGCEVVVGMKDYNTTNRPGSVASMGPYRLFLSQTSSWWRTSQNPASSGADANSTRQNPFTLSVNTPYGSGTKNISCYFTDAETMTSPTVMADQGSGFALYNYDPTQANAYTTICLVDIWD